VERVLFVAGDGDEETGGSAKKRERHTDDSLPDGKCCAAVPKSALKG
jgi:hypothetical protein